MFLLLKTKKIQSKTYYDEAFRTAKPQLKRGEATVTGIPWCGPSTPVQNPELVSAAPTAQGGRGLSLATALLLPISFNAALQYPRAKAAPKDLPLLEPLSLKPSTCSPRF